MKNYIESNLEVIKFHKKYYQNEVDVDKFIKQIEEEKDFELGLTQFQRFRIFIDSCFLLWNREKFEKKYFKNKFIYKNYFDGVNENKEFQKYFDFTNEKIFDNHFDECNGFYLLDDKTSMSGWDQLAKVRNGLAHMQYGNFTHIENGPLLCFGLLNKDKGVLKSNGVVIEPIFHDFVKKFFSNYTNIGVPFKHTWFTSSEENSIFENGYFYEVTYKDMTRYNGDQGHKMNELTGYQKSVNSLEKFLEENKEIFDVKKTLVSEVINEKYVKKLMERYKLKKSQEEYCLILKFILDPETEISNFLVHIGQLNDRICDYIITKKNYQLTNEKKEELILGLKELYEDKCAHFAFHNLFNLLTIMNIAFRIQDEYYPEVNFRKLNTSIFRDVRIDTKKMIEIINKNILEGKIPKLEERYADNDYLIDKLRNSLMHGNIRTHINDRGELEFIFSDIYKGRHDEVRIESNELADFSTQAEFYENIPNDSGYY